MYSINDNQIDYILNDIRRRGVEMEDLQYNLLDHICCIVEQNLNPDGDFEDFYKQTIAKFFKHELWEIEEETINLLIFKNYYVMKKIMILSGVVSAVILSAGIIFKFMHWPGAGMGIVLGTLLLSLVFLPLMFTLKIKEKQKAKDKIIIGIGTIAGIMISLGILFKLMFWPGANMLIIGSFLVLVLLFLPVYFINGIRNPETKVNTIVTSILMVGACGLLLALVRSPKGSHVFYAMGTDNYVRSQQILAMEKTQTQQYLAKSNSPLASSDLSNIIYETCESIKAIVVEMEVGQATIDADFESKNLVMEDHSVGGLFMNNPTIYEKTLALLKNINEYNSTLVAEKNLNKISVENSNLDYSIKPNYNAVTNFGLLNQLTQIQMQILQNQQLLAMAN